MSKEITEKQREDFLHDLVNLCYRHGLSLAHEDTEGGFLIHEYNDNDIKWLLSAIWEDYHAERQKLIDFYKKIEDGSR